MDLFNICSADPAHTLTLTRNKIGSEQNANKQASAGSGKNEGKMSISSTILRRTKL